MYSSNCEETLGEDRRERKEWMSEDTWKLVEEKRQLKSQDEGRKDKKSKAGISTCLQPEEQRGEEKLQ